MASRPSGLRQPSSGKSSNSNIASASGGGVPETPEAKVGSTLSMSRLPSSSSIRRKIATPAGMNPGLPGYISGDSGLATDVDNLVIGDTVYVCGDPTKRGKICFIGEVEFAKGDYAGIVLDLPIGNHDGIVKGKRYFQCAPSHGLFSKLNRLTRDPVADSPSTPRASQSMVSSDVMSPDAPMSTSGASVDERTPSPFSQRNQAKFSTFVINPSLILGERVIVASATGGTKIGILRYLGATEFAAGDWAGVELLTPMGKNNGTVGGRSYFQCKDKHGLFVPASKVISSPVNKTPRRHGSRESLISVSSLASSAASRSIRRPSTQGAQCLPGCSLRPVLAEKEKHIERLIKEREMDRFDLGRLSRQFEEKVLEGKGFKMESIGLQTRLEIALRDQQDIGDLRLLIEDRRRKMEDLQYAFDEEKIMKADLQAQLDSWQAKSIDDVKNSETYQALNNEMQKLRATLEKGAEEVNEISLKLTQAHAEVKTLQKRVEEMRQNNVAKENEAATHQEEVLALKKAAIDQSEVVTKLNQQLSDKKRREDEMKERIQKLEIEFETTLKQKCSLEAEVIDLVNSKSGSSELLTGKIKDLSQEIQDLREKLQSTEEDKAVLRRINAEFKSRIAKNDETEAALKKCLDESYLKALEEKTQHKDEFAALSKKVTDEFKLANDARSSAEKSYLDLEMRWQVLNETAEKQGEDIKKSNLKTLELVKNLETAYKLLEESDKEKTRVEADAEKNEQQLTTDYNELVQKFNALSDKQSHTAINASVFNEEIKRLVMEKAKAKESMMALEKDHAALKMQLEEEKYAVDELRVKVAALKKDKSALKEQVASYKADTNRFEEIEKGLSQELLSLRNKMDQKVKAMTDLEKDLAEKKADMETNKAIVLDAGSPEAHIDFLNSIIVDLQRKNEELNVKLNVLVNGGSGDADANSNRVAGAAGQFQSLRSYCDICEKFDLHDTEECPAQVQEDNTHYGGPRGESRPYCETCEIFGHVTGECDDQETY